MPLDEKHPGQLIRAADWNEHLTETKRLESAKVDRDGDSMTGALNVGGALTVAGDVTLNGRNAIRDTGDGWLRLNQQGHYTSGTHTPVLLTSGSLNVGGANGWGNPGFGNAVITGRLEVKGDSCATRFCHLSDARSKNQVEPLGGVLERLAEVHGVSFVRGGAGPSAASPDRRREIGVVAQEVEAVFPELVAAMGLDDQLAVDYGGLTAVLVEAVKQLKDENDELRRRVSALEARQ